MRYTALAFLLLIVAGVTSSDIAAAEKRYIDRVKVIDDEFSSIIELQGPSLSFDNGNLFNYISANARLRTALDRASAARTHQIYVRIKYRGSRGLEFHAASFPGGDTVELRIYDYDRRNCVKDGPYRRCVFFESVAIKISDPFMRAHAQSGIRTRLRARSGDTFDVTIPPDFVSGQLEAAALQ